MTDGYDLDSKASVSALDRVKIARLAQLVNVIAPIVTNSSPAQGFTRWIETEAPEGLTGIRNCCSSLFLISSFCMEWR